MFLLRIDAPYHQKTDDRAFILIPIELMINQFNDELKDATIECPDKCVGEFEMVSLSVLTGQPDRSARL